MKKLKDPWSSEGYVPLDRLLERWQFPPLLTAFLALILGFVIFQSLGLLIAVGILSAQGIPAAELAEATAAFLTEHLEVFLLSNAIAQIIGLAMLALVLGLLHSSRLGSFLRFRKVDGPLLLWSLLGLFVLLPVVWWLGELNQLIPVPDQIRQMEAGRELLTERILGPDANVVFVIGMVALIPAFCEEILFRGYAQRQMERTLGIAGGILLCGLLFGMFHLTILQLIPLTALGIYLAYLTWRTGSLWPAIVGHFANNTISVIAGRTIADQAETHARTVETMETSPYIVVAAFILFFVVVYLLEKRAEAIKPT